MKHQNVGEHISKDFEPSVHEQLHHLTMPTLIVIGENDLEYLRLSADFMAQHIPDSTKVIIPNAAHLPNMEHPQLFHQAIEHFLTVSQIFWVL